MAAAPHTPASPTARILLAGDVQGRFDALFARVAAVAAKAGPFDALLCVGQFFEGEEEAEAQAADPDAPDAAPPSNSPPCLGELAPYVAGHCAPPVPTHFLGATPGPRAAAALAALAEAGPACGIAYLGRAGVATIAGLSVAFLDGAFHPTAPAGTPGAATRADGAALENALAAAAGDVDLFLTCEWPSGVLTGVPPAARPARGACPTNRGSAAVAALADAVRARYHVAGKGGGFYARPPYINPDRGTGPVVTRFVGLGPVGGPSKWVHALQLTPAARLPPADLAAAPADATPSPYSLEAAAERRSREAADMDAQPWRWMQPAAKRARGGGAARAAPRGAPSFGRPGVVQDARKTVYVGNVSSDATEGELEAHFARCGAVVDVRRRAGPDGTGVARYAFIQFADAAAVPAALALNGSSLAGRDIAVQPVDGKTGGGGAPPPGATAAGPLPPPPPAPDCWFCLSNPAADVDLVLSVGTDAYLALDKGPIDPTSHVLVLPIEHAPSYLGLPPAVADEIDAYLDALAALAAADRKGLFVWERYAKLRNRGGGNHCQVNALALPAAQLADAEAALKRVAQEAGVPLVAVPGPARGGAAPRDALRDVVGDGEYYVAALPCGARYAAPVPRGERHPLTFGRTAAAALAGAGERADWKACLVAPPEEVAAADAFKARFKGYDPAAAAEGE